MTGPDSPQCAPEQEPASAEQDHRLEEHHQEDRDVLTAQDHDCAAWGW